MNLLMNEYCHLKNCTIYTFTAVCLTDYRVATVRVENFEVFLISRFSWVADDTKIIHVEGGINTRKIF